MLLLTHDQEKMTKKDIVVVKAPYENMLKWCYVKNRNHASKFLANTESLCFVKKYFYFSIYFTEMVTLYNVKF